MQLNRSDDYPFHQALAPFVTPATSDSHYNDGYYFAWYRPGEHWFCGLRLHPNNNVMDGYAGVVAGGEQRSVRFSRALRPAADHLEVGPFRLEITEAMAVQRLVLDENESGVSFDVAVEASAPPFLETPRPQYRHGRLFNHVVRYTQVGRANGSASLDGEERAVDGWFGCRDHSWGIRSTMGPYVPIGGIEDDRGDSRAIRIWVPFEVDDHAGFFHVHEDSDGVVLDFEGRLDFFGGRSVQLATVRHRLRYIGGTRRLSGGAFTLVGHGGEAFDYEFDTVVNPAHPQGFGYTRGWRDGGQPGVYRGPELIEVDRFRVDDPERALGPDHVPEERRLGGTEFASRIDGPNGTSGMAHVEHMIYGPYRPSDFD